MNKAELIEMVAQTTGLSKAQSQNALNAVTDAIGKTLKKGDSVVLPGFGSFSVTKRKARTGRNPSTGEKIKIAAKRVPRFKPGSKLKEIVSRAK